MEELKQTKHIETPPPRGFCPSGNEGTEGSEKSIVRVGLRIQTCIAVASFGMAVLFGIAGFITPPPGQIHDSILYLIAQFLLVTTSIFGVSAVISNGRWTVSNK